MKIPCHLGALAGLLASSLCLSAETPASPPLFAFDATALSEGEIAPSDANNALGFATLADRLSQGAFTLSFQNTTLSAEVIALGKDQKALRIKVPETQSLVAFSFQDDAMGGHIDLAKPFYLEIEVQPGEFPVSFTIKLTFIKETSGWMIVALGGVLAPDGPYRVFKSGHRSTADSETGPSLVTSQPVTLRFELLQQTEAMSVKSSVIEDGQTIFEADTTPDLLTRVELTDLKNVSIEVSPFAGELNAGSLDVLRFKAWQ